MEASEAIPLLTPEDIQPLGSYDKEFEQYVRMLNGLFRGHRDPQLK